MTKAKRPPPPVYRKPSPVPLSSDVREALEQQMAQAFRPAEVQTAEAFAELRAGLCELLREGGAEFVESASWAWLVRGYAYASAGGERVRYRTKEVPPFVSAAAAALDVLREVEHATGEARVLAAYRLGMLVERCNVEARLAPVVESYKSRLPKPRNTDAAIRQAVVQFPRLADAAAELNLSERQLRAHRKRLNIEKRKSVRPPPRKK